MTKRGRPPTGCPECGSADRVPIFYGYPSAALFEARRRGEVALGGCVITGDDEPARQCGGCGTRYGEEV